MVETEPELVGLALALGASAVQGDRRGERTWTARAVAAPRGSVTAAEDAIREGGDPLGDAFTRLRPALHRRDTGATYTPRGIVEAMVAAARGGAPPARVVDPGCGSGRFLVAAGRAFPSASLHAVERDPLAALVARAHLAAAGLAGRSRVDVADFRSTRLPEVGGRTLYLGNPPYVRHHGVEPRWKRWLTARASARGLPSTQLAGLHVHFLLAIAEHARAGDRGILVTAAEWLDARYGSLPRALLIDTLGLARLDLVEPDAAPFEDAAATAVVIDFEVGVSVADVRLRRVARVQDLAKPGEGRAVPRAALRAADRWGPLTRPPRHRPSGWIELGELCRVHRGQATGDNRTWIMTAETAAGLARFLFPCVTRAAELFAAGETLASPGALRRVLDLPVDLDTLRPEERGSVRRFLARARLQGTHAGFLARHRRAWWAVGLRGPAPVLATYMARRPPAFVLNPAGARHLNVAHGLYPRDALAPDVLSALAAHLARAVSTEQGRTYAGGLTKFEPGEMERLWIPPPDALASQAQPSRSS